MKLLFVVSLAALVATACRGTPRAGDTAPQTARRDANFIGEEEIRASSNRTVYDLIQALRPAWLLRLRQTVRLGSPDEDLVVYVDGIRFGGSATLQRLTPREVGSLRYYTPTEAQAHFGPGHLRGVIEVLTTQGR